MEDLGDLGFWLAAGMVVAASIIAHGLKEREKERQKQETLREMMRLEAEGKLAPETLAYMRTRDAAEQHIRREAAGLNYSGAANTAFAIGFLAFMGGVMSGIISWSSTKSWEAPVSLMLGIWVGGALVAGLIYFLFRGKKNVPPSGA